MKTDTLDYERIKEIYDELFIQFGNEQIPILIQAYMPPEDIEYIISKRIILFDRTLNGDKSCIALMSYLMVKIAFDEYDDHYWEHFKKFMSPYNISSSEENCIKAVFNAFIEDNGFHVLDSGNKYVNTILFNTGIPCKHANKFFNEMLSRYELANGVLSESMLMGIIEKIEDKNRDNKQNGNIKAVRAFLADQTYSSAICKAVLKKIDQSFNPSSSNSIYDLGLLENPYNDWFKSYFNSKKASIKKIVSGIIVDVKTFDVYYIFPEIKMETPDYNTCIEMSDGQIINQRINIKRNKDGLIASSNKIKLTDQPFLKGFKILCENKLIFEMSEKSHLLFDKNGCIESNLTKGTNYIVYDESIYPDISTIYDSEKQFINVSETRKLNDGETFCIDGENYCVGFSETNKIDYFLNRVDVRVTADTNEGIDCVLKHPVLSIHSSLSAIIIYLFDYDGSRLFKKIINSNDFNNLDLNILYKNNKSGFYKIIVRFGNIRKEYRYILISEFSIHSPYLLTTDGGKMSISIDKIEHDVQYVSNDYSVKKNILVGEKIFNFEIKTPTLAYQLKANSRIWQFPSNSTIDRTDMNRIISVSPGLEVDDFCTLDFYANNIKITDSKFSHIQEGLCNFKISDVVFSLNKFASRIDCIFKCKNQTFKLFSLKETYRYDVDYIDGACLVSVFSMPMNKHISCEFIVDNKPKETFQLKEGNFRLITYTKRMSYTMIETNLETILEENNFELNEYECPVSSKYNLMESEDLEMIAENDMGAAHELGKRYLKFGNFQKAAKYLNMCIFKGYYPAYEDYSQYHFLFGNEELGMKYLKIAADKGSKTASVLLKLIV